MRFATANTDWAKRGDPKYLDWLTQNADVILIQEAKDFRLDKALPAGWRGLQDVRDQGRMGACIAVREELVHVKKFHLHLGSTPIIAGHRIRMLVRWIAVAELENKNTRNDFTAISAHFPPARFKALQPKYEDNLRYVVNSSRFSVVGTDANQQVTKVARDLHLAPHARGIVGLMVDKDLKVENEQVRSWGIQHGVTDHPSVAALITHKDKK